MEVLTGRVSVAARVSVLFFGGTFVDVIWDWDVLLLQAVSMRRINKIILRGMLSIRDSSLVALIRHLLRVT